MSDANGAAEEYVIKQHESEEGKEGQFLIIRHIGLLVNKCLFTENRRYFPAYAENRVTTHRRNKTL